MDGVLVIDKPAGPTSHDIVYVIRRAAGLKKVGHTGTLDPMATGVLVILIGRATRIAQFLELEPKEYIAEAVFGIETDTQDTTGTVIRESPVDINIDDINRVVPDFTGAILQIPPMVSAIKIGGRTLYKLAREGKEIERPPRRVTIYSLEIIDFFKAEDRYKATFKVLCSGGTYIRTLIHDIGARLGVGATMSGLRRTRVGRFTLSEAVSIDSIKEDPSIISRAAIGMDSALSHLSAVIVKETAVQAVRHGQILQDTMLETGPLRYAIEDILRIKDSGGNLLALGRIIEYEGRTAVAPKVVFN